jgi:hypothetical protein
MQPAIEANKQLVASLKEAPLINAFRKTDSQQACCIKTTGKYYYTSRSMPINYWKQVNCLWRKLSKLS